MAAVDQRNRVIGCLTAGRLSGRAKTSIAYPLPDASAIIVFFVSHFCHTIAARPRAGRQMVAKCGRPMWLSNVVDAQYGCPLWQAQCGWMPNMAAQYGCPMWLPNVAAQCGWMPNVAAQYGCPMWEDAQCGCPMWLPNVGGCPMWLPNMAAQCGWMPNMAAQYGCPIRDQKVNGLD